MNIFKNKKVTNIDEKQASIDIDLNNEKEPNGVEEQKKEVTTSKLNEEYVEKLQVLYKNGKVKEHELTRGQIYSLIDLYEEQISKIKASNEFYADSLKSKIESKA